MPIDPSAVGAISGPSEGYWTSKDCLLYALGVGAGTADHLRACGHGRAAGGEREGRDPERQSSQHPGERHRILPPLQRTGHTVRLTAPAS